MDIAKSFYKVAKSDIEAAKILFLHKKYPDTIYRFQQSVEKLSKAFGLKNNIIEIADLTRGISHKSERVFTKQIKAQQPELEEVMKLEELFPDFFKFEMDEIKIDLSGYSQQIHESTQSLLELKSKDFVWLSHEDLDYLLDNIITIDPTVKIDFQELKTNLPDFFKGIIFQLETKFGKELTDAREFVDNEEIMDGVLSIYQQVFPLMLKSMYIYSALFFLSLITSGHNQMTRYPCTDCGCLPEENYDFKTPIVNRFNELAKVLDKAIMYYEEIEVFELANPVS